MYEPTSVDQHQLRAGLETGELIAIMAMSETAYAAAHIPGSIALTSVSQAKARYATDAPLVVYCTDPARYRAGDGRHVVVFGHPDPGEPQLFRLLRNRGCILQGVGTGRAVGDHGQIEHRERQPTAIERRLLERFVLRPGVGFVVVSHDAVATLPVRSLPFRPLVS